VNSSMSRVFIGCDLITEYIYFANIQGGNCKS